MAYDRKIIYTCQYNCLNASSGFLDIEVVLYCNISVDYCDFCIHSMVLCNISVYCVHSLKKNVSVLYYTDCTSLAAV